MTKNTEDSNLIQNTTSLLQLVSFKLGEEEFAVDILKVQEINRLMEITQIPETPDFVEGIVNLRGRVIPVINLRNRFNLENKSDDKDSRIIVVEIDSRTVGFTVDSVSEVLRIPANAIEPPPDLVASIQSKYISGVVKLDDRLLILLDLNKILSKKEMELLEEAA